MLTTLWFFYRFVEGVFIGDLTFFLRPYFNYRGGLSAAYFLGLLIKFFVKFGLSITFFSVLGVSKLLKNFPNLDNTFGSLLWEGNGSGDSAIWIIGIEFYETS